MEKQTRNGPRFWISLAFSVLITLLTFSAARNAAENSVSWYSVHGTRSNIKSLDKAVRAYRQKNGSLPKSLQQLNKGALPSQTLTLTDLWNPNHLYLYKVEGNDFRIISYGRDGQPGGGGLDCDLSNDNLYPPESRLSYHEFLTNPQTTNMAVACFVCSLLAFFIGWITIGKLDLSSTGYKTLAVKLIITIGGTFYITFCLVMFHVPSGH